MGKYYTKILGGLFIFLTFSFTYTYGMDVDYIQGKDRYETAAIIASKMEYSSVILVNGNSLVDGLSASGLSGATNAPILLTQVNVIPQATLNKLSNANTVYLVGGEGVISKEIENKIINMGKKVIRLGGKLRYDTSILVANEIEKIKGVQEIYYVNGLTGEADAMSIAPVAASKGNPVILTDGSSTNYRKDVQSYAIGGVGVMNYNFDNFSTRIDGINRYETNKNVINIFFPNKNHVNLSKSYVLIDALTASALKEPVVLVADDSDKSVIAGAKSATVLGDISEIAVSRAKAYLYGDTVVFYAQHQDDETLFAGSAIVDAIKSVGVENVHIVLVTDGDASNVFTFERYKDLSYEEKVALRYNEFKAATGKLGVNLDNVVFLKQPENQTDDKLLKDTILYFENNYSNVTHITHSYKYENHNQHMHTGSIVNNLYKEGLISDCRFLATEDKASNIQRKYLIESVADNSLEKQAVLDACNEYKLDNQDMIREGIGYKSVKSLFDKLMSNPKLSSYLHESGI